MKTIVACPWLLCPLLVVALLMPRSADGQVAKETPLITRVLPDVPGREVLIETVSPSPRARSFRHIDITRTFSRMC